MLVSDHYVVIAEYGITVWTLEIVEEAGALPGRADGESPGQKFQGHIIAGEKHCIGIQAVDAVDGIAEQERLGELVQVNIAELRRTKSVEGGGKAWEKNVAPRDFDPMPLDLTRINRQASGGARACGEEAAPRDVQLGERLQQYPILS